jgi:hypothetical protein
MIETFENDGILIGDVKEKTLDNLKQSDLQYFSDRDPLLNVIARLYPRKNVDGEQIKQMLKDTPHKVIRVPDRRVPQKEKRGDKVLTRLEEIEQEQRDATSGTIENIIEKCEKK